MGKTEAETPAKSDKVSSPPQASVHPYSEWAAMQAYYGPGAGIPSPYFSSAVVSGHAAHPYMWSPQLMIPPFGPPYPPMYPHGGGYSHSSVPLGSPAQGQGNTTSSTTSEAMMIAPQNTEIPAKTSINGKERGIMKRLKGFDGLAVSSNNADAEDAGGSANKRSQSGEGGTDGSSDGTNSQEGSGTQRKRICSKETTVNGKNGKDDMQCNSEDANATKISLGVNFTQPNLTGKSVAAVPLKMASGTEFRVSPTAKSKTIAAPIPLPNAVPVPGRDGLPPEHWIQEERELKRERRKQSNRESARRSRLRKQAETEELAVKVENLASENVALKSELCQLTEMSEKLRRENSALLEKLENPVGCNSIGTSGKYETQEASAVNLENLLSRMNNSSSSGRSEQQENTTHEKSGAKLHQLLEPCSRTDTVAAG